MKFACMGSIAVVFALSAASAPAEEQAAQPAPPSLEGVTWTGQGVTLSDLRGKSVVILVYVTDRDAGIDWPKAFLAQLKSAVQDKPVVVLAVNADKKADIDLAYMNARDFNGPNILHGHDPLLPSRLGLASGFYRYLLIDPAGKIVESDSASMYFTSGGEKRYALPREISASRNLGEFEIIDAGMPAKIKQSLWPYELGRLPSETDLRKARAGLTAEEQKLVDAAFDRYLDAEVKKIRQGAKGAIDERLSAFERAKGLYATFHAKAQAAALKEIGTQLNQDQEFKKELAAKQAYDKVLQQCATAKNGATIRPRLMQALAKQYKDTRYGTLAANDGKAAGDANAVRPAKVYVWKDFTEEENQAAVAKQKKFFEEVSEKITNAGMKSYETKRFLFCSDLPPQIISTTCLPYLDSMYTQLCTAYGLDAEKTIWRGKATVFAFANEPSFHEFEKTYYHDPAPDIQGLAHNDRYKNVVISLYSGNNPRQFVVVLVHETGHGFSWCYKSAESLPSWLDEGASEWIAHRVVTGDTTIDRKVKAAMVMMGSTHSLGGDFFTLDHIHAWQYGAAASITDFLLNYDPGAKPGKSAAKAKGTATVNRYRKLIDGIKDGLTWEDALHEAYGLTPAELARAYGQSIGIPDLQP